ncbi:BppU family phage baseplate upper protein [Enterococcus avium]
MFKTNEEIIIIQAKATTPIPTGVVFWSHDKGTAKMLFQLQKDYVNQTLSEGTIVPICLDFVGGRHIYHAVIEDAINGIVSIVLEDNILGYVGRVTGSIYIELPDSRSLDTAGRFTFDIKRSPIDLNTPELEDYYWQGFNEIIDEYHQTINTIKSEAKALLDSLTTDVTKVKNDIATVNVKIAEIRKKLDDNDVFTKAESSANVIYQVIGKDEVEMTLTFDLKNKIASSDVENPNSASFRAGPTLYNPNQFTADAYINYLSLYSLDGTLLKLSNSTQGNIAQVCIIVNILEELQRFLGQQFFIDRGAVTEEQKVAVLEMIVTEFTSNIYGFGVGTSGNLLTQKNWYGAWTEGETTTANTVTRIGRKLTNSDNNWSKYINGGKIPILITTGESDGITSSSINLDYANVEVKLKLSANEHIKSMIAANHIENLATEEEAETGTDNAKAMTPLRTAQQINKKAVTIAGNQTIGGIKNFKDGLMINDVSLSTITRKVIYEADGVGGYFNAADKFTLGASGKIDKIVLLWSRVDDTAGTLLNYSWSQTVLSPDDLVVGNSYRIQMTTDNYKFVTFANESGNVTISGANENSVAPNRIYRIKRIIAYLKN